MRPGQDNTSATIARKRDLIAGLFVTAVGLAFFAGAQGYDFGSSSRIGPGFLPFFVSLFVALAGVAMTILAAMDGSPAQAELPNYALRPTILILLSIALFGLGIERVGFVPSIFVMVAVAAMASRQTKLIEAATLGAVMAATTWLLFAVALGIPVRAFVGGLW